MKLSAPKNITFWIAVVLVALGLLGSFAIAALAPYALWLAVLGFVVLALGNLSAGM
jgi:hypothetical protein